MNIEQLRPSAASRTRTRAPARLLAYGPEAGVVLAAPATVALVPVQGVIPVPGMPAHALGLLPSAWGYLPLIDLAPLLGTAPAAQACSTALVVAWQSHPGAPLSHGALCAPQLIEFTEVDDTQQCDFPDDSPLWQAYAHCCVTAAGQSMPLLDVARVFARPRLLRPAHSMP